MEKIIDVCRRHPIYKIWDNRNSIMKTFPNGMKQRFRIAPIILEIFKDDIYVMVDTNLTHIQAIGP